jgi:hypothetical protein
MTSYERDARRQVTLKTRERVCFALAALIAISVPITLTLHGFAGTKGLASVPIVVGILLFLAFIARRARMRLIRSMSGQPT